MLTDSDVQTFLEGEGNQNTERKTERYELNGFGNAFLAADNENRQLGDLPQADFCRVPEKISCVGKDKVNNWRILYIEN